MKKDSVRRKKKKLIFISLFSSVLVLFLVLIISINFSKNNTKDNKKFINLDGFYNGTQIQIDKSDYSNNAKVVSMITAYNAHETSYSDYTITISSAEELYYFSLACNNYDAFLDYNYKLLCNIDFDDYIAADFIPVGWSEDKAFTGTFDGDGFDISNLELVSITSSNAAAYEDISYFGMFSKNSGTIKNFGLIDPIVTVVHYITTLSNGAIANVCGYNSGEISGVYVRQLSKSLKDECGITAIGGYRVSGLVGNNEGEVKECYVATNSVYNYTATDIIEFANIALQNSGTISNTYFYNASILSTSTQEENGPYNFSYTQDLGVSSKSGNVSYGKWVKTKDELNQAFANNSNWSVKSSNKDRIEYYFSIETPVRRTVVSNVTTNSGEITSCEISVSNARDFVLMFELMNCDSFFASNKTTFNIKSDIDLAGIPANAYTYKHGIAASIVGSEIEGSVTLMNGLKTEYPTIYNADILSTSRTVSTTGIDAYGLFPYLIGSVSNLNVFIKNVDLDSITNNTNNALAIGAISGYVEGGSISGVNTYMEVSNTSSSNLKEYYLGGIAGILGGEGSIIKSTSAGSFNLVSDSTFNYTSTTGYMNGIAVGGSIGYIESSSGNIEELLSAVNMSLELGSEKTYAIGGVVGAGYTTACSKLENVGNISIGSDSLEITYDKLYVSGIIGRLLGLRGDSSDVAQIKYLTNQGNVLVYGSKNASKTYISGILNADIQTSSTTSATGLSQSEFKDKAGQIVFYASALTNRANIKALYGSAYNALSSNGYLTEGINILSENGFRSEVSSVYNLGNKNILSKPTTTTYKTVRTLSTIGDLDIDLSVVNNYSGVINSIGATSVSNTKLTTVYNLRNVLFTTSTSINSNILVSGVVSGEYISYDDVRNEGNLSFTLDKANSTKYSLYVSGVFDKLSINNTAKNIYNAGHISILDKASSNMYLDLYLSGICRYNEATLSDSKQNPLNPKFDNTLIGSMDTVINNGSISVTSQNYDKEQTLYETSSSNNPVTKTQTTTTYLKGSVYASGVVYSNSGIISNAFNLGDITLDLFAKTDCEYYAAGIASIQNGEYAQIRDSANNGTIRAINTSNTNTAKMIVSGIVAKNNSSKTNISQVLAFDINYGTIIGFNGTPNVTRTSTSSLNCYVSGILGYGISNIVNILNYGNIYGSEAVGSIIASFNLADFNNTTCNLANTINYGNLYELLKYKSDGATWNYANYNNIITMTYTSIGTYNATTNDYYYLGAMFGLIDFNSQSNLNIRFVINLFKGAPITQTANQLNIPSSTINTQTFITVDGVTNVFGGSSVGYAPLSTVEDSDGNIGVFSSKFVFRKAINGEGIDNSIVTDSYIEDYFEFVRFDKINDTLLEKIGWKTIAYLDAAEHLAKNVKAMAVFVDCDSLTNESSSVSAAFTNSSWVDNINQEVLISFIDASIGNTEFSDTLDQIINYILFDNDCISDISQSLRESIVESIISYYDNEDANYYEILQKLLYDELLAKIVSGDTANYQAVQNKIREILQTSDNLSTILKNYLDTLLADSTVLNPLFADDLSEYYITKKVDLLTSLLDGYSDDTLKTMVSDIIGDNTEAGSQLKYQAYLKNNETTAKELYSYIIASNTFSGNDTYLNLFNKVLKKYDIETYVDNDTSVSDASVNSFEAKSGSTYINSKKYSYTKNYTELWNIVKNDSNVQQYIIDNYFKTVTDPTSGVNYNSLIAKATEYNSTYQSQNEPSSVSSSNGKNSTSGVFAYTDTVNSSKRYIYTPDDLVQDSTYYYGPFDVTGNTLNVTAGFSSDFNKDIYNISDVSGTSNGYTPFYMSLSESDRNNYINQSNTNSTFKSIGEYYWNDYQNTDSRNQWVSNYIINNKPDDCNYFLQKLTKTGEYIKYGYDFSDSYSATTDTTTFKTGTYDKKGNLITNGHDEIKDKYLVGYATSAVYTGIWHPISIWIKDGSVVGVYLTSQTHMGEKGYTGIQTTQYTYYQISDLVRLDGVRTRSKSSGASDDDEISIISSLMTDILANTTGKKTVLKALASYANKNGLTKDQSASAQMLLTALKNTSVASSSVTNEISLSSTTSLENLVVNITVGTITYTNVKDYLDSLVENVEFTYLQQLTMAGATDKEIFKAILLATLTNFENYDDDSSSTKVTSKDLTYYIYKYHEYLKTNDADVSAADVVEKLKTVSAADLTALAELSKLTFDSYKEYDSADGNIDEGTDIDFGGSLDMKYLYDRISYISGTGSSAYIDQAQKTTWASTVNYQSDATKSGSHPQSGYAMPLIVSNDLDQTTYNTLASNGYQALASGATAKNKTYEVTASNNIGYYTGNGAKINAKQTSTNIKSADLTGSKGKYTDFKIYTKTSNTSGSQNDIEVTNLPDNIKEALLSDINSNLIYNIRLQNQISFNSQVELDEVVVAGKTYNSGTQYLPNSAIWFTPQQDGYARIVLSSQGNGKKGFTLYQLERESSSSANPYGSEISSVTPITTVYKDSDGNIEYNPVDTTNKTLIFNKDWTAEFTDNTLYYYEIPVKAGVEYALGNTDGNGAYLIYLDIGQNAGSSKVSYPNLTDIENRYNTYYNTTSEYASYLASNLVKVTTETTLTIYEPTIILVKATDGGVITVNGKTTYTVDGEEVSVNSVKFSSSGGYRGFYLSGSSDGTTYTIGVSGTTIDEILVLEQDNAININTETDKITFVDGSEEITIFKGLTYEDLKSFDFNIDYSNEILDALMLLYPTIRKSNTAYDSQYEYTIFSEDVFTNEKLKEIVKLIALADYDSLSSSLGKLVANLDKEYYDDLLKTITDEEVMKNMAQKFISLTEENTSSYSQEMKYIIAAYIGNDYLNCSSANSLTNSILYTLLNDYLDGEYQFINGDKSIDVTKFDAFMKHIGQTSNIDGYGIFALSSSKGIKNGTFIPDNINLTLLDTNYDLTALDDSGESIIKLIEDDSSSWRSLTNSTTLYDITNQNSVNYKIRVLMKQLKLSISTSIFELDLKYDDNYDLYASESLIDEVAGIIYYYVPKTYLDNIRTKSTIEISRKEYAESATFNTNNNTSTSIDLSQGYIDGVNYIVDDAVIVTAEDTTVVTKYKVVFSPITTSDDLFEVTSDKTSLTYLGGDVTLTITANNIADDFDFKSYFKIVNGTSEFSESDETFTFDSSLMNNGIVSDGSATLKINVAKELKGGTLEFVIDYYGTKKTVTIIKSLNENASIEEFNFEGNDITFNTDGEALSTILFGRAFDYSELTDYQSENFYLYKFAVSANATVSVSASYEAVDNIRIKYIVLYTITSESGSIETYKHILTENECYTEGSSYANLYKDGIALQNSDLYDSDFVYDGNTISKDDNSLTYNEDSYVAVGFNRGSEPEYRIKYNLNNFYTIGNVSYKLSDETINNGTAANKTYAGLTVIVSNNNEPDTYKYNYIYSSKGVWENDEEYSREYTFPTLYIVKGYSKNSLLERLTFLDQSVVVGNTVSVMKPSTSSSSSILAGTSTDGVDGKEITYNEIFSSNSRDIEIKGKSIRYNNDSDSTSISDYYSIGTVSNSDLSYYAPTFGIEEHAQIYQYTTLKKLQAYGQDSQTESDNEVLSNHETTYLYVPFIDTNNNVKVFLVELDSNNKWNNIYETTYSGSEDKVGSFNSAFDTLNANANNATFTYGGTTYTLDTDISGVASDDNISLYMDYIGNPLDNHFWYVSYVVFSEAYLHGDSDSGNVRYYHISIVDASNTIYFDVTLWAQQDFAPTEVYMTISENIYKGDETTPTTSQISGYLVKTLDSKDINGKTYNKYLLRYNLQTLPKGYFYFYLDLPKGYGSTVTTDMENQIDETSTIGKKEVGSFLPFTSIITKTIKLEFILNESDNSESNWGVTTSDYYFVQAIYTEDSSEE